MLELLVEFLQSTAGIVIGLFFVAYLIGWPFWLTLIILRASRDLNRIADALQIANVQRSEAADKPIRVEQIAPQTHAAGVANSVFGR